MTHLATNLEPHADQAVRHAVDAYIDGRLLPTFEGDATFETRNSRYRMVDGVLFSASDDSLLGAELVGWLVEYVSRSEVTAAWRSGARAVLVDTRNDGIKGPHIIVTSATRGFRVERPASAPALRVPSSLPSAPYNSGSRMPQGGSSMDQSRVPPPPAWSYRADEHAQVVLPVVSPPATLPPPPALPSSLPFTTRDFRQSEHTPPKPPHVPPLTMPRLRASSFPPPPLPAGLVRTPANPPAMAWSSAPLPAPAPLPMFQPPPPPPRPLPRATAPQVSSYQGPSYAELEAVRRITATIDSTFGRADENEDSAPTVRHEKAHTSSRLSQGSSSGGRSSSTSGARAMNMPSRRGPLPPASSPHVLSRSLQRGMPLR